MEDRGKRRRRASTKEEAKGRRKNSSPRIRVGARERRRVWFRGWRPSRSIKNWERGPREVRV
jgi:hypothetical protein